MSTKTNKRKNVHISIISFILINTLFYIIFVVAVPKNYNGENNAKFDTSPTKNAILYGKTQ